MWSHWYAFLLLVKHKTIDSVLERGVKLDSLVEKSSDLSAASQVFMNCIVVLCTQPRYANITHILCFSQRYVYSYSCSLERAFCTFYCYEFKIQLFFLTKYDMAFIIQRSDSRFVQRYQEFSNMLFCQKIKKKSASNVSC